MRLGQRPWLPSAVGTLMPELVLETKHEENGEERRVGARVWILYIAYLNGADPMRICR